MNYCMSFLNPLLGCVCNEEGSDGLDCNHNGICTCKPNISGDKCDQCQEGYINFPHCDQCDDNYHGYPNCKPCSCNPQGSENMTCDKATGKCVCKANVFGDNCDKCPDGLYGFPDCQGTFQIIGIAFKSQYFFH